MKKLLALLLIMITVFCALSPAYAAAEEAVQPRYTYIDSVTADYSASSGVATCRSSVQANSTYRVRLVMYLQRYENSRWTTIMTWEKTGTMFATLSKTYNITSGYTYRTYAVGYVLDANGVIMDAATIYAY